MAAFGTTQNPLFNSISSSDRYGYEGLPPELAAEEQAVNRRQQMANYLMQQGMHMPQGQMVGRFYVAPSPVQGLANLAQIGVGALGNYQADTARKDIAGRSQKMLADAMQQYKEASAPVASEGPRPTAQVMPPPPPSLGPHAGLMPQPPQQPVTQELPGPGAPVMTPRTPEERRQAIVDSLLLNRHPQAQAIGKLLLGELDTAEQRGLDRDVRRESIAMQGQNVLAQLNNNLLTRQMMIYQSEKGSLRHAELLKQQQADKLEVDKWKAKLEDEGKKRHDETLREIAGMKGTGTGKVKLKPGERMTESGDVEAIPGSDVYIKQSGLHAKDLSTTDMIKEKASLAQDKINYILDPKNKAAFEANFGGWNAMATQYLPGAQDMRKEIDSFKSNMKSQGLELMRQGGAIGQMTEREWPIVEQMIDSIDPALSEPRAREVFQKIGARMQRLADLSDSTYQTEWGNTQYAKQKKSESPAAPKAPAGTVRKYNPATGKLE